jgi:hypothetical protein
LASYLLGVGSGVILVLVAAYVFTMMIASGDR